MLKYSAVFLFFFAVSFYFVDNTYHPTSTTSEGFKRDPSSVSSDEDSKIYPEQKYKEPHEFEVKRPKVRY